MKKLHEKTDHEIVRDLLDAAEKFKRGVDIDATLDEEHGDLLLEAAERIEQLIGNTEG